MVRKDVREKVKIPPLGDKHCAILVFLLSDLPPYTYKHTHTQSNGLILHMFADVLFSLHTLSQNLCVARKNSRFMVLFDAVDALCFIEPVAC